jgi:hypothetical protein
MPTSRRLTAVRVVGRIPPLRSLRGGGLIRAPGPCPCYSSFAVAGALGLKNRAIKRNRVFFGRPSPCACALHEFPCQTDRGSEEQRHPAKLSAPFHHAGQHYTYIHLRRLACSYIASAPPTPLLFHARDTATTTARGFVARALQRIFFLSAPPKGAWVLVG